MVPRIMKQGRLAPWFYLLPALVLMTVFIVYPTIGTIRLSLLDATQHRICCHHLYCRPALLGDFRELSLRPHQSGYAAGPAQ